MAKLNDKNENTEKIIHLMVTSLCDRKCPDCCNKQYDLNDIPYVTEEELENANTLCITGGEPFKFSNPNEIARYYRIKYPNIKNVYVYTNAIELVEYILRGKHLEYIDGVSISIKNNVDAVAFKSYVATDKRITKLPSNRLYVFNNLFDEEVEGFTVIQREWQKEFVPANNSIFRKV